MRKLFLLTITLLLIFSSVSHAAIDASLLAILKDGVGLRALSMGGAFTAVANDPSAVFYNPAGIAQQNVGYLKGYDDISQQGSENYEHTFFVTNAFGFGFWQKKGLAGEQNEVFAYSFGRRGSQGMNYGVTFKNVVSRGVSTSETIGYSYDIGMIGQFSPRMRWGVLFQDLIENMQIPASVRAGIVYKLFPTFLFATDLEFRNLTASNGPNIYAHLGAENTVTRGLKLRAGYYRNRWTGGISTSIEPLTLEYALITAENSGGVASQLVGIKWSM